ncbi:MAG TPA: hypothetical protein VHC20_06620 [Candidatus Paceibacterota bacterium]|nr:hypothetical protein [Candidatus Paceibacterota bacterium]
MTTEPPARGSFFADPSLLIPVGMAIGSLIGQVFHDFVFGMSVGLMAGSVVAMFIDRKRKRTPSLLMISVGALATVTVVALKIIQRT